MKSAFIDAEPVTSFCRILHVGRLSFLILTKIFNTPKCYWFSKSKMAGKSRS